MAQEDKIDGARDIVMAMKNLSLMFQQLYQSLNQNFPGIIKDNPFAEMSKLDGYPLIITENKGGKNGLRSELKSIQSRSFAAGFFLPPKSYKEKKMDMEH